MGAQLTPIFPSDLVSPGVIYFARLDPRRPADIKAWWIVLRCSEDVVPQTFLDSKDPQSRAFPFWIIGRSEFIWLSRDALFLLHPSQKSAFERPGFQNKFAYYYALATGPAKVDAISFFRQELISASKQHAAQVSDESLFLTEDENDDRPDTSSASSHTRQPRHKRQKTAQTDISNRARSAIPPISSEHLQRNSNDVAEVIEIRSVNRIADSPRVKIKTEAEEKQYRYANGIHMTDRVRIFIGTRQFRTSRRAIDKSPVLTSYIQRDEMGMFIMHPRLNQTQVEDFLSLLDFMQQGEISPRIIDSGSHQKLPHANERDTGHTHGHLSGQQTQLQHSRHDSNNNDGNNSQRSATHSITDPNLGRGKGKLSFIRNSNPLALDGLRSSADYSNELVRAGRLYLLGKAFCIANLNAYLLHRVTMTEYRPYTAQAIITVARIIFGADGSHRAGYLPPSPGLSFTTPSSPLFGQSASTSTPAPIVPNSNNINNPLLASPLPHEAQPEPMEQWLISSLAENFKDIMQDDHDREAFWDMEKETVSRRLVAEVYARCAESYRSLGGIPVRID